MHSLENHREKSFNFRIFIVRDIREDGRGRAVPYLQNDSAGDFQHTKQCKYKEKHLSKFSNIHKRKQTSLFGKSELQMFFPISGRHVGAH